MRLFLPIIFLVAASASVLSQENSGVGDPASSQIKDIQTFGARSGIAYTSDALYRTDDGGHDWHPINLPKLNGESIARVLFADGERAFAILSSWDGSGITLARTSGGSWSRVAIDLGTIEMSDANLEDAGLAIGETGNLELTLRTVTSSNFSGTLILGSRDDGSSWQLVERSTTPRTNDEIAGKSSGQWSLITEGTCLGKKTGCVQETRIFSSGRDITPPQIREQARVEKESIGREIENSSIFSLPPGGSTRTSLNRGFDKCTAAPVSQMQTWWENSPFYDSNIYISGRNRGCSQPQLSAAWVSQVSAMGWGLIPTIVGYQSPCSVCTTCQKHSTDPAMAEAQGRGEADIAIADANNIGLTTGTVLYYDMERYDDVTGGTCSTSVKSFLKGWTDRLHELGYVSGVYGSPTNAVGDWLNIPLASRMDAIWMARWDNNPSVWSYASPSPPIPTNAWANHQRIKQWQAPHNETWGGVTFNIDGNIADGPVAGVAIAKNKNADFDGDGKSDISVFRPDGGVWYVFNSGNSTYTAFPFGLAADIVTPGDYDGDGKTDYAVFRPSTGIWHLLTKAGTYAARQFGTNGDIPVAADFNGDGETDLAVFRPSNGFWYIANSDSLGTFTYFPFGLEGDKPVQGDYDGDGKADIAVYRPSNGVWYVARSSNGAVSTDAFGLAADLPAQGDYDGDGRHDYAVYRNGIWYLQRTTAGFTAFQFGIGGDLPATGDFDGDGRADAAVFRPADGLWYLLRSQSGFYATPFGLTGDRPIPNAYLPQ